jgi:hypothetical protein
MTNTFEKPSLYLIQKAEILGHTLDFFLGGTGDPKAASKNAPERQVQFLAQIEFWDWEMENVIAAYADFDRRSRTWESENSVLANLRRMGIPVRYKSINRVRWSRSEVRYGIRRETKIVAPYDVLSEVVEKWNTLLTHCEKHLDRRAADFVNLGARFVTDLSTYVKHMPNSLVPAAPTPTVEENE